MEQKGFHRKLTAILSADVAGCSRLMQDDETATVKTLEAYKQVISHADRRMGWQNNTSTSALMN
jgi:adenylate cyclase